MLGLGPRACTRTEKDKIINGSLSLSKGNDEKTPLSPPSSETKRAARKEPPCYSLRQAQGPFNQG